MTEHTPNKPVDFSAPADTVVIEPPTAQPARPRRGSPRVFSLLIGIISVLACIYALTDGVLAQYSFGLTWWLAGAALLTGVLILASTLWPKRN